MTSNEEFRGNNFWRDQLCNWNQLLGFICKYVSSCAECMGYRSDNHFISACWDTYRFFRKRETRHSERLNEAYTELKKLKVLEDEKYHVSLKIINKQIEDIQYLQQAILHLRSYKETYKIWNDLEKLETKINESLEEIEPTLRETIRKRASEPQNYPNHTAVFERPNTALKNIDYYNMTLMINDVVQYVYKDEPNGMLLKDYLYLEKNIGNSFVLTAQNQNFIIESKKEDQTLRQSFFGMPKPVL
jgi:hypothetical protein